MENDEVEVEHVIEFFVEQLKVNKEVIAVKEKIVNWCSYSSGASTPS